ncbi:MAG TPA: hypothetical protein VFX43_15865 [Chitinophagaceae bacterium]|nr:hypothetical protein [Chitinophagaceae bacterium]
MEVIFYSEIGVFKIQVDITVITFSVTSVTPIGGTPSTTSPAFNKASTFSNPLASVLKRFFTIKICQVSFYTYKITTWYFNSAGQRGLIACGDGTGCASVYKCFNNTKSDIVVAVYTRQPCFPVYSF